MNNSKKTIRDNLKAYHLEDQISVIVVLVILTILSLLIYCTPGVRDKPIAQEVLIAVFTSFMVTIIVMISEIFFAYKNSLRDGIISDIHKFGIESLNENKEIELRKQIQTCQNVLWISGYRLLMTKNLMDDIYKAIEKNGIDVRLLLCPPWEEAYKLIYDIKDVMNNYFDIISGLYLAQEAYRDGQKVTNTSDIEVRFTKLPLFNDTYKVDKKFITGPYMLSQNNFNKPIQAKDFFSYNIVDGSELYDLIKSEFETIWSADGNMTITKADFMDIYKEYRESDLNDAQKIVLFTSILKDVEKEIKAD